MTWEQLKTYRKSWAIAKGQQDVREAAALAPTLPPCPIESHDPQGFCYRGNVSAALLPGVFNAVGVVFHVAELAPGARFDRTYAPTPDQRFDAEYLIVATSRDKLLSKDDGRRTIGAGLSINQYAMLHPDFRYFFGNFALNPVRPTSSELNDDDGFAKWIDRGGYPLSWDVAHGRTAIASGVNWSICTSIMCACPSPNSPGGVAPSCVSGWLGEKGIQTDVSEVSNNWNVYVGIDEGPPYQFHLAVVHNDPSWLEKGAAFLGEQLKQLGEWFCNNRDQVQNQMVSATADKCVDAKNKLCVKGAPGCICQPASPEVKAGVNLQSWFASKFCAGFAAEYQEKAQAAAPTTGPLPPPIPESLPAPFVPIPKYANCVARYSKKRRLWAVYCPPGKGLGYANLGTAMSPPLETELRIELPTKPPEAVDGGLDDKPIYKEWWFWAAVAGSAAVVGTGGYFALRRRRRVTKQLRSRRSRADHRF
jgi:hypothetical protein